MKEGVGWRLAAGGKATPPPATRHPPARPDRGVLLIAFFKLAKAITLIAAGIGIFRLVDPSVAKRVEAWLAHVQLAPEIGRAHV